MSTAGSQVLFLGELPFWLKISQSIVEAPSSSFKICRAPSLVEALRRLDSEQWQALLLDLTHPSAQELLAPPNPHPRPDSSPPLPPLPLPTPHFSTTNSPIPFSSRKLPFPFFTFIAIANLTLPPNNGRVCHPPRPPQEGSHPIRSGVWTPVVFTGDG